VPVPILITGITGFAASHLHFVRKLALHAGGATDDYLECWRKHSDAA